MGNWNRKQAYITFSIMGLLLFVFGQNFELVPKNPLLQQQDNNYMDLRMPAGIEEFNPIKKYFFDKPPQFNAGDMTINGVLSKTANTVIDNYFFGDQFNSSEAGKALRAIEEKSQTQFTIGEASEGGGSPTEFTLTTNSSYASMKIKTDNTNTTCGYSLRNQTFDMQFQTSKLPGQSFGMGYDVRNASGSVTMQMSW